ncbi:hypothetical protein M8J77_022826 [Diaphorina citri]|nr:hypothetical protein M8J77_022826 [Diaphorina citri]
MCRTQYQNNAYTPENFLDILTHSPHKTADHRNKTSSKVNDLPTDPHCTVEEKQRSHLIFSSHHQPLPITRNIRVQPMGNGFKRVQNWNSGKKKRIEHIFVK